MASSSEAKDDENSVFVTVGTYKFDELVQEVTKKEFQKMLVSKGYSRLVVQIGNGSTEPGEGVDGLTVEWFRLKSSIHEYMSNASLIISHGGSGSIFESLTLGKPLVVAINEQLMDNHQIELARQLSHDNHLVYATCSNLQKTVEALEPSTLTRYKPGNPKLFADYIDTLLGFDKIR